MAENRMRKPSIPCQMRRSPPFITAEKKPPTDWEGVAVSGEVVTKTFTKSPVHPWSVRSISVATMESLRGLQLRVSRASTNPRCFAGGSLIILCPSGRPAGRPGWVGLPPTIESSTWRS